MLALVEIHDQTESGYLSVDLIDILRIVEQSSSTLVWSILEVEATGNLSNLGIEMLDLENTAFTSDHGFPIEWLDLISFATMTDDIVNMVLVGCKTMQQIPRLGPVAELYSETELVIEMIDSSLWSIYAKDVEVRHTLLHSFRDAKLINISEWS